MPQSLADVTSFHAPVRQESFVERHRTSIIVGLTVLVSAGLFLLLRETFNPFVKQTCEKIKCSNNNPEFSEVDHLCKEKIALVNAFHLENVHTLKMELQSINSQWEELQNKERVEAPKKEELLASLNKEINELKPSVKILANINEEYSKDKEIALEKYSTLNSHLTIAKSDLQKLDEEIKAVLEADWIFYPPEQS